MEKKKALLIINPISGTRSKHGLATSVSNHLFKFGIEVETKETKAGGDAFRMASEAVEKGFDMVITAGGDGTVNEAANALAFSNCTLGILPFGSGNGLARSVGVPQDTFAALKLIESGYVLTCDRGIVNDKPFYCTFGIGFDAAVSEKFATMKKRGRITYIRSAFREFLNYRSQPYAIVIDGKVITEKALLIAVCNAPQYGNNAYIGPKAKLTDGLLDITVVHSDNPFNTLLMSMDMFTGMLDKNRGIGTFRVPALTIIRTEDGPVHLDGEPMQMGKKLAIKCEKKALRIFAPEKNLQFQPFISPIRAILDDMRYDVMDKFRQFENTVYSNLDQTKRTISEQTKRKGSEPTKKN
ncbi:MAG: diacylglycerol kinase family lipid kinase [Muribaculaceae bacterium]|nr:diacylglycerol kinase family lipid kinase [Muribaculaceae bacterium]